MSNCIFNFTSLSSQITLPVHILLEIFRLLRRFFINSRHDEKVIVKFSRKPTDKTPNKPTIDITTNCGENVTSPKYFLITQMRNFFWCVRIGYVENQLPCPKWKRRIAHTHRRLPFKNLIYQACWVDGYVKLALDRQSKGAYINFFFVIYPLEQS